jgi:hypothetical protein
MKRISLLLLSMTAHHAFAASAPQFDPQQLSQDIQTLS